MLFPRGMACYLKKTNRKLVNMEIFVAAGGSEHVLPETLVFSQREPAVLSGAPERAWSSGRDRAGALHCAALRLRGALRLLCVILRRHRGHRRPAHLQVLCRGPGEPGELGQSPSLSPARLPPPPRARSAPAIPRWGTTSFTLVRLKWSARARDLWCLLRVLS